MVRKGVQVVQTDQTTPLQIFCCGGVSLNCYINLITETREGRESAREEVRERVRDWGEGGREEGREGGR